MSYIAPAAIPSASADQLSPILLRLLECPQELLSTLSSQCAAAINDLPSDSRPDTFEGLLDVARFCVEDEPGWETSQRAKFIGGHPRIGAPITTNTAELSEESRKEQLKGGNADPETIARLAKLNSLYEARYPGLRFVTYVAGRPRSVVADELAGLLGSLAEAEKVPEDQIRAEGSKEWEAELERGSDALWEIAVDRAGKLTLEVTQAAPEATPTDPLNAQSSPKATEAVAVGQDVPFLSLATFRMLVLSSPVLESFFETDLTQSFYLEAPEKSQSGGAYAWHTAPALPGAPRAVPAVRESEASYSRDVTTGARGRVVGLLGGLLGEEGKARMNRIADQVGQRLQTHTVEGPKPSFGRKETLDGGKMDTQELREREAEERKRIAEERKSSLGSRLASALKTAPERGRTVERMPSSVELKEVKRMSLRGTDMSSAAETLRAAQEALVQERPAFVIDEVGGNEDDGEEEEEDVQVPAEVEEVQGLVKGKEAQMAKDLRSAPAQ